MTRVVYPSVRLSANGAAALLDTVDDGYRLYDLPSGDLRWNLRDEGDITNIATSASGNAVAWSSESGRLVVTTSAGRTTRDLPAPRAQLRAVAVSDAGDRIAYLAAPDHDESVAVGEGRLIVIPTAPPGDSAVAPDVGRGGEQNGGISVPVFDSGFIFANGDLSLIAIRSTTSIGDSQFSGAFTLDNDTPTAIWTERSAPLPHGVVAVFADWIFGATKDGIAGWRRNGERATIPGTMRERLIFSPDGRHLLAYRAEGSINVTSARMLFRLIDISSLDDVRQTSHLIEQSAGAQFVLDAALTLFEVRATRAGDLTVKKLGWDTS